MSMYKLFLIHVVNSELLIFSFLSTLSHYYQLSTMKLLCRSVFHYEGFIAQMNTVTMYHNYYVGKFRRWKLLANFANH